jgi:hypothetical protein
MLVCSVEAQHRAVTFSMAKIWMIEYLLTHEELNRPLRLRHGARQEEFFAFRWKDAEAKRLAAYRRY